MRGRNGFQKQNKVIGKCSKTNKHSGRKGVQKENVLEKGYKNKAC